MFRKANPVWEKDKSAEKNYELYFRCQLGKQTGVTLRIATSCEYQLWINGIFIAFGPAKAAHGFFKVDTVLLDGYLHEQINTVVLKTVSANINSFAVLDQPPFVTAEILCGDACAVWTGNAGGFYPYYLGTRIQKVQRYSYQRTFTEIYHLSEGEKGFFLGAGNWEPVPIAIVEPKQYIPRDVRFSQYKDTPADRIVGQGTVDFLQG